MNLSNTHSYFLHTRNSIRSLILRCGASCIHKSQVHPEVFDPDDLEFVQLGSQRVIRVLHLSPNSSLQPFSTTHNSYNCQNEQIHKIFDVSSEEYWFTRSNRPFRIEDACDCISNTLTSNGKLPKSWEGVTGGFSELKESLTDSHSNDLNKVRIIDVIGKFADDFVKVVLDDALLKIFDKQRNLDMKLEDDLLIDVWDYSNVSNHSVNIDVENNISSYKEAIADVHYSDVDFLENKKGNGDSKKEIEGLLNSCSDGIVNPSFIGTASEPDELPGTIYKEDELLSLDILRNKSEFSSAVDADSRKSEFTSLGIFLDSRVNDKVKNATMVSEVQQTPIKIQEYKHQAFAKDIGKGSSSTEESRHVTSIHQDECSPENNPVTLGYSSDYAQNYNTMERKSDRCWHSKTLQKPFMLFLHGAGSSADIWSVQLEYFASAGYEVLAPDMLGHGYSSAPDTRSAYTFDRLLEDILQIFDRFVPDHQKCIVIGHSYGSCFAAAVARYRSQQVVQLVLVSSGGPSPLVPNQAFFSFPSCVMSFMKPFLMCGFKRDLFYAPRGKHLPPCCTYELPPYVLKHVESGQEWSDGDSAFHRRILVPTLLVHGLKDPYITLVEECEMERTIPRSFLEVISNAGHMVMLDTPEQLCHMIHSFLMWWSS